MFKKRPTSVEGAIQGLLTAISDLEHVANTCHDRCHANRVTVSLLENEISRDTAELQQADAIAAKLREITQAGQE